MGGILLGQATWQIGSSVQLGLRRWGVLSWALPSANFVTQGRMVTPWVSVLSYVRRGGWTSWSVIPPKWGFILFSNLQLEILGAYSPLVSWSLWMKHWNEKQTVLPSHIFNCRTVWLYFNCEIVDAMDNNQSPMVEDIINELRLHWQKDTIYIYIVICIYAHACIYSHHEVDPKW